jgi:hypothetical protein
MSNNNRYHIRTQGPSQSTVFTFEQLQPLIGGHRQYDAACPACAPDHSGQSAKRKVLRLFRLDNGGISFRCARCEEQGWVAPHEQYKVDMPTFARVRQRHERESEQEKERQRRTDLVTYLYHQSHAIAGTLGEIYYREHRQLICPLPKLMRYLPASGSYPAAILMPFLPLPFMLDGKAVPALTALHITRLNPDGSKIDKIMLGKGSVGIPLLMGVNNSIDELIITEGPEDALQMYQDTDISAYAAGSKDRLPALAGSIPPWVKKVWIRPDIDADGGSQQRCLELEAALRRRKYTARLLLL